MRRVMVCRWCQGGGWMEVLVAVAVAVAIVIQISSSRDSAELGGSAGVHGEGEAPQGLRGCSISTCTPDPPGQDARHMQGLVCVSSHLVL